MSVAVIRVIPFRNNGYRALRKNSEVVVHSKDNVLGQEYKKGIYDPATKTWVYDNCLPGSIKASIEASFV